MLGSWSLTIQMLWGLLLESCGRIDKEAKKVPKSWKFIPNLDKMERKLLSKFGRGCRSITCGHQDVFTIKRMTVLKFFRAIVKGTFRALLTVGRK
jgi:hypothetical protein